MTNQAQIDRAETALKIQVSKLARQRKSSAMNQVLVRELCGQVVRIMSAKDEASMGRATEAADAYALELREIFGEDLSALVMVAKSINSQVRAAEAAWS